MRNLINVLFAAGVGFVLAGIWTRWLLEDRLLQTGTVLLLVASVLWLIDERYLGR